MKVAFLRSGGNYDTMAASDEAALLCTDQSLTIQSQKEEADINNIVRRYLQTGELPAIPMPPTNVEFTEVFDFQSAMNYVRAAQTSFAALPAETRSRFNNDPELFVNFASDPENVDDLVKMGLAVLKPVIEPAVPVKVEVVTPATPVAGGK